MTSTYATTPCKGCGKPIVFVTTADGKTVPLDPRAPVYVLERDGDGGAVWLQDNSGTSMVSHFATCSHANQFSASKRKDADISW